MEDLHCTCGHIIETHDENMPHVADVMPNMAFGRLFDKIEELVESLIDASKTGNREAWFDAHYPDASGAGLLEEKEMFSGAFMNNYMDIAKPIVQCYECGRIWIQRGDSEKYIPFKPDGGEWWGVLGK